MAAQLQPLTLTLLTSLHMLAKAMVATPSQEAQELSLVAVTMRRLHTLQVSNAVLQDARGALSDALTQLPCLRRLQVRYRTCAAARRQSCSLGSALARLRQVTSRWLDLQCAVTFDVPAFDMHTVAAGMFVLSKWQA